MYEYVCLSCEGVKPCRFDIHVECYYDELVEFLRKRAKDEWEKGKGIAAEGDRGP